MAKARERRTDHRTRIFFDGITALDIAMALLVESMHKTDLKAAGVFLEQLLDFLNSREEITSGTRARLERLVKAIVANNSKKTSH